MAEVHVDNGSEFINWGLIDWAKGHDVAMSRSRRYKKNDNAHVEQRNGRWVRRHAFRYETAAEFALLNQFWPIVMARKNHLLPCVQAISPTTTAGHTKRVYDKPATPYQRLIDSGVLDPATRGRLAAEHDRLNPADLARRITDIQNQLIRLAERRTETDQPAA